MKSEMAMAMKSEMAMATKSWMATATKSWKATTVTVERRGEFQGKRLGSMTTGIVGFDGSS